ncbi:hypothetical protein C8F01DRAFT_1374940 [Mycena amicta]|nr:hypothetical protein C8F01DRAFT_1374940 [Mycena amicta]
MAGLGLRPRWFRDTFDPQYARAQVESALAGSIDDIIEDLSDRLTDAVYAEIIHANNPLEKVKILFRHLDAQLGNEALVHAFEMAASKHGRVGYMFLSEQERGERARSKLARATAFGIVRDSRYGLRQHIVICKLYRELTLDSVDKIAQARRISPQQAHLMLEKSLGDSLDWVQKRKDILQISLCSFILGSKHRWDARLVGACQEDEASEMTRGERLKRLPDAFHHKHTVDVIIREKDPWEHKEQFICDPIKCVPDQDLYSVLWMVDIWAKRNGSFRDVRVSARNPFFYSRASLGRENLESLFLANPYEEITPHEPKLRIAELKFRAGVSAHIELVLYLDRRSAIQLESSSGAIFGNVFSFGETKKYGLKDSREGILRSAHNVIQNDNVHSVRVAGERKTRNYRWTELLQAKAHSTRSSAYSGRERPACLDGAGTPAVTVALALALALASASASTSTSTQAKSSRAGSEWNEAQYPFKRSNHDSE